MEKIRNNQPFEGELTAPTGHFIPPKSHHKRAGISGGQKMIHQQRSGIPVMGQMKAEESILRQQQKGGTVLASVTNEGVLTTATPTTAFRQFFIPVSLFCQFF